MYFIEVEYLDILNAWRGNPEHCPLALAAQRCTGIANVSVGKRVISMQPNFYNPMDDRTFLLSEYEYATTFIREFDNKRKVVPFSKFLD